MQRNYRGSNPDLQITLVKPHNESPSSSSSSYPSSSSANQKFKASANKKSLPAQSLRGVPPLNPQIIAAANELQKLQHKNMPFLPFLNGLDVQPSSSSPRNSSSSPAPLDNTYMSAYLSAFYNNPLLQGGHFMSNISPAVEFLKMFNSSPSSSTSNRIPSSKN